MSFQGLFGEFVVFEAEADDGFAVRLGDEGVKVVDVEFGLEEGFHEVFQLAGIDFDDDELAFGKREAFGFEDLPGAVWIVNGHANNGAIGGVEDHEAEDVDGMVAEEADEIVQPAEAVGGKDGELNDMIGPAGLGRLCRHEGECKGEMGGWRQLKRPSWSCQIKLGLPDHAGVARSRWVALYK